VTVLNASQPVIPKNAVTKLKNLILKAEAPQEETLLQKKLKALNGGKNE
ncbi:Clp protease ClpP, partial [Enterococcus faecium]|nr:Clp protease ClpP [Enterococcus faecium]